MLVSPFFPLSGWPCLAINILLDSGKIEVLKDQLATISTDRSVQVLLITWGFGGLLEGMAGYGTSVAIPAAILVTLGFRPLFAVLVSLIANSEPTTFGAVGIAETVLMEETGCPLPELCKATIQQLYPFIFLIPITLAILADRRRQALLKNILLGTIVGGVSFLAQYATAVYLGPEMPAILGSICSIIIIIAWSKWNKKVTQFPRNTRPGKYTKRGVSTALSFSLYY